MIADSLAASKIPDSFDGRSWVFVGLMKTIRQEAAITLLLLANAGAVLVCQLRVLIVPDAGFGKSALAVELYSRKLKALDIGRLALVVCSFTQPRSVHLPTVIRSIALQCRRNLPGFNKAFTVSHAEALSVRKCEENPVVAFINGVLQPLSGADELKLRTHCFVLDSLDESILHEVKSDSKLPTTVAGLFADSAVVNALAKIKNVRVVATSRKEERLTKMFSESAKELDLESDRNKTENTADLLQFCEVRLRRPRLFDRCSKQFSSELPDAAVSKSAAKIANVAGGSFLLCQMLLIVIEDTSLSTSLMAWASPPFTDRSEPRAAFFPGGFHLDCSCERLALARSPRFAPFIADPVCPPVITAISSPNCKQDTPLLLSDCKRVIAFQVNITGTNFVRKQKAPHFPFSNPSGSVF